MNEREKITSCKSHIASVSLTDWCIMILKNTKKYILFVHIHNIHISMKINFSRFVVSNKYIQ